MKDQFGRRVEYLRVSVTDKCNLRCTYCMPEEGLPWMRREQLLTYEEITEVVRMALEKDRWLDASNLQVRTSDGKVRLDGTLSSEEQKRRAEYNAWYVCGVHEVDNQIVVRPPSIAESGTQDADLDLDQALEQTLL